MAGRDLSAELFGDAPSTAGRDLSAELFKPEPAKQARTPIMGSLLSGGVKALGGLGATLMTPYDMLAGNTKSISNPERRADINAAVDSLNEGLGVSDGLETAGKIGTEALAGGGAASLLGRGVGMAAPRLGNAIASGGFTTGTAVGGALSNLATRAAGGAISGGLTAGMVNPDDAGLGAALGGGLPVAAKAMGETGKFIGNKLKGGVSDEVSKLAQRAQQLGIDIPIDRLTNSRPMNAVASALNYIPFSGRAATEDKMLSQLNQAVSKTFGQDSSNVTMALRKAGDKLGGEFDSVLKNNGVAFDNHFLDDLARIHNTAEKELGSDALKPIVSKIDDLMEKGQSGVIDGQAAYNIKRDLDRIGRGNTPTAFHALELKSSLMDALNRSLGTEKAAAFATTRQQYGNMLALEKLAKNGAEGEISAARLGNMQNINNQPLQELADISAQFIKGREGQHGAMQRAVGAMTGAGLLGSGLTGAGAGLALGAATGRGVNSMLNSDSLRNYMIGTTGQKTKTMGLLSSPEGQKILSLLAPVSAAQ